MATNKGMVDNILQTMGDTPLVRLNVVTEGIKAQVYAKVEFFNPGGSIKDRIGLAIIEDAERNGTLKPGGTIVESTSGNTGVGLAIAAAIKGYKTIFVMPDKMSDEKIRLLRAFGARVIITPTAVEPDDPRSYYKVAERTVEETPNAILANQYHNPINPLVHYESTGPEIWEQTEGKVTHFITGMGTGGTISGTGKYLKEQNPDIQVIGVDPIGSILYDLFYTGEFVEAHSYLTEGVGEDFLPSATDLSVVSDIVQTTDRETMLMTRRLVREEGIFCGNSSGSAVAGALKYIKDKNLSEDALVVIILADSGSRYLSKVFNDDWMRENGLFGQMRCEAVAADILSMKPDQELITLAPTDLLNDVIGVLKSNDISQAPVLRDDELVGVVREIDLLNYMFSDHQHSPDETIADVIHTSVSTAGMESTLEDLMGVFAEGQEMVMITGAKNGNKNAVQGILTKIDVLDYVARHCI